MCVSCSFVCLFLPTMRLYSSSPVNNAPSSPRLQLRVTVLYQKMTCRGTDIIISKAHQISIYKSPHVVLRFVNIDGLAENCFSSQCKTKQKLRYWKRKWNFVVSKSKGPIILPRTTELNSIGIYYERTKSLFEFSKETPYPSSSK